MPKEASAHKILKITQISSKNTLFFHLLKEKNARAGDHRGDHVAEKFPALKKAIRSVPRFFPQGVAREIFFYILVK